MKNIDVIKKIFLLNPNADVYVNIGKERVPITSITYIGEDKDYTPKVIINVAGNVKKPKEDKVITLVRTILKETLPVKDEDLEDVTITMKELDCDDMDILDINRILENQGYLNISVNKESSIESIAKTIKTKYDDYGLRKK